MDTFPAANAPREIQCVDKFHSVHWLEIADVRANPILVLDFFCDPLQHFRHLLRSKFLVMLLQELFSRREVSELAQRSQARRQRRYTRCEHRRFAQEAPTRLAACASPSAARAAL